MGRYWYNTIDIIIRIKGKYHPPQVDIILKVYHPFHKERISLKKGLHFREVLFSERAEGFR